jgi:hypothetical protein
MNTPTYIGDNLDAALNTPLNMLTVNWNSARGWGDYLVDGPSYRGTLGNPGSITNCQQTDFGWWMDTNGEGVGGSGGWKGTKLSLLYNGLMKFYAHVGYTNMVGMAYHYGHNPSGNVPAAVGRHPYSNNSERDQTQTWNAIKNELDNGRSVIATTMGYEIQDVSGETTIASNGNIDDKAIYYTMGAGSAVLRPVIDGAVVVNGEEYTWEVADGNALGHTVLIVGYITAGSANDIAPSAFGLGATNWLIVRDNLEQSHRNVVLPWDQSLSGSRTFWQALLSTCYTNPIGASHNNTCSAAPSSSSSIVSSPSSPGTSSASAAAYNYYYLSQCGSYSQALCSTLYQNPGPTGGIPVFVSTTGGLDASQLYTCVQADSSTLKYKIVKVKGKTALANTLGTSGEVCCLLIQSAGNAALGGAMEMQYTWGDNSNTTSWNDCNTCQLAPIYSADE